MPDAERQFRDGEAEQWLLRNIAKPLDLKDPVLKAIETIPLTSVLEIGCSNGWRLDLMAERYGCAIQGIDPLPDQGRADITTGTADKLPYRDAQFDLVIYGFCLYLCDPQNYFKIAAEGDRVLQTKGHLVVYDFESSPPTRVPYHHKPGLWSHKMNFPDLWLCHPYYRQIRVRPGKGGATVTVMQKTGIYGKAESGHARA